MTPPFSVASNGAVTLPPGPPSVAAPLVLARIGRMGLPPVLRELSARYGTVSSFPLGAKRAVFVDEPELIERILVRDQHAYVRDYGAALARDLLGEGLLTTEDPVHLARRRLMQPAFHRGRVATYGDAIVAETERAIRGWDGIVSLDIGREMAELTLAVVGEALLGADLRDRAHAIVTVLRDLQGGTSAAGPLLVALAPYLSVVGRNGRRSIFFRRERARLLRVVAPLVDRRRAFGLGTDLLSTLIEARDEAGGALDDAALQSELVTLVLAGHETTANALTWCWQSLAHDARAEACVHAEVDRVLGGGPPQAADVSRLPYASAVFAEALRLFPPAPAFARRPLRNVELGGFDIAAGTSVYVSAYVTQRSARYFDDPQAFRPERWFAAKPPKFAYFPFGGGSKACIGASFAELEGVLALATIAQRYRLRATQPWILPSLRTLTRPERAVLLHPEKRDRSSAREDRSVAGEAM